MSHHPFRISFAIKMKNFLPHFIFISIQGIGKRMKFYVAEKCAQFTYFLPLCSSVWIECMWNNSNNYRRQNDKTTEMSLFPFCSIVRCYCSLVCVWNIHILWICLHHFINRLYYHRFVQCLPSCLPWKHGLGFAFTVKFFACIFFYRMNSNEVDLGDFCCVHTTYLHKIYPRISRRMGREYVLQKIGHAFFSTNPKMILMWFSRFSPNLC